MSRPVGVAGAMVGGDGHFRNLHSAIGIRSALAQLRQELREEVLRALEERFTEMLARQRKITQDTLLTHKWRERVEALTAEATAPKPSLAAPLPVLLIDDVMGELDAKRRTGNQPRYPECCQGTPISKGTHCRSPHIRPESES